MMLFQPIRPMLGYMARLDAIQHEGKLMEPKLDGIRTQIHKEGDFVRIYSRGCRDMTELFPSLTGEINAVMEGDAIADAEIIGGRNFRTIRDNPSLRIFDMLYANGESLMGKPLTERKECLSQAMKSQSTRCCIVNHCFPESVADIKKFFLLSLSRGYEGIMIKTADSEYFCGRSFEVQKLKPKITLDLVLTEAFYGKGFYKDMISRFVLACRDGERLVNFCRVYAGLTFYEKKELARILQSYVMSVEAERMTLKPEIVLEIVCSGFEKSKKYELGIIPRGPRIARIRWDKTVEECDTKERVMRYAGWFQV